MIKFKVFNRRETEFKEIIETGLFGWTRKIYKNADKYSNNTELYQAVADFISSLGANFIAVTGTPTAGSSEYWYSGDTVVWYSDQNGQS